MGIPRQQVHHPQVKCCLVTTQRCQAEILKGLQIVNHTGECKAQAPGVTLLIEYGITLLDPSRHLRVTPGKPTPAMTRGNMDMYLGNLMDSPSRFPGNPIIQKYHSVRNHRPLSRFQVHQVDNPNRNDVYQNGFGQASSIDK